MQNRARLCANLTFAAAVSVSAACGGGARPNPRDTIRPDIGEVPAELRGDYESFAMNCSKCHDLDRALAAPVTDKRHWDIYVAKMMRTAGSAINAAEAPHILRFLYWYTDQKTHRGGSGFTDGKGKLAPAADAPATPEPASAPSGEAGPASDQEVKEPVPEASGTSESEGESTP